MQSNSSC